MNTENNAHNASYGMSPHTIIFIGPQGSGKGTQIERLSKLLKEKNPERKTIDIQTGRRFRALAAKQEGYTEREVHRTLDTGILQPLFLSVVLWGDAFHHHADPEAHILIDGFPRTIHEAHVLESALAFYSREHVTIVHLNTPEEVVRKRMEGRARPDDTPASIEARLRWYREETLPVVTYYHARPNTKVLDIDGTMSIDAVSDAITKAIFI
jgi:adenylate kinase family enzyme